MPYKHTPCGGCKEEKPKEKSAPTGTFPRARFIGDKIFYPKRGWEPPPPIEGYERMPGNAWMFVSVWPACSKRQLVVVKKQCGATDVKMICKNEECPLFHTDVRKKDCDACDYRSSQ